MVAYVDGSYDPNANAYGYSFIILEDGEEKEYRFSGAGNTQHVLQMRNVAGELIAAMCATKYAITHGKKHIEIRYDYEGIERWVTGAWKAKRALTLEYKNAMKNWAEDIDIRFKKVTAHTGDIYNEMADTLAKNAITEFVRRKSS